MVVACRQVSLALLICLATANAQAGNKKLSPENDLAAAIKIANAFLPSLPRSPSDLKLIKAENLIVRNGQMKPPAVWELAYKDRSTISSDGLIGKGGELFIEVDLKTKKAKFMGAGE